MRVPPLSQPASDTPTTTSDVLDPLDKHLLDEVRDVHAIGLGLALEQLVQLVRHPHLLLARACRQPCRRAARLRPGSALWCELNGRQFLHNNVLVRCSRLIFLNEGVDGIDANAAGEVAEALGFVLPLRLPHVENGLHCLLQQIRLHLVLPPPPCAPILVGRAAHPDLVEVGALANKRELGHVRAGAAVGAPGHAHDKRLSRHPHLVELRSHPLVELGHYSLCLRLGKAAQRERGASNALSGHGVNFLDVLHAVAGEDLLDISLVFGLDAADDDVLVGGQAEVRSVLVHDGAESCLELEVALVLDAALLNVDADEPVAVTLRVPAEPVDHPPLREGDRLLEFLSKVLLGKGAEVVDAERVHEVLETRVRTHLPVAVVALRSEDCLHGLCEVVLVNVAQHLVYASESGLLVVRAAHTTANHHVVALEGLAILVHDHDQGDVMDEDVHGVVPRDSDGDLELAGQVAAAVQRLLGVSGDDALARVVQASLCDLLVEFLDRVREGRDVVLPRGALNHVFDPVLRVRRLLAIHPEFVEGRARWLEELRDEVRRLKSVLVGRVRERGGRGHDVAIDVTTSSEGRSSCVVDTGNDSLEVFLPHPVDLPRLPGGCTQITLAHVLGQVVESLVRFGIDLPAWVLESEHKLIRGSVSRLVRALQISVLLHVTAVMFQDDHGIMRDADVLEVLHLLLKREAQVAGNAFGRLNLVLVQVGVVIINRSGKRLPWHLRAVLLTRSHE
mmetsp:Transcript_66023/g.137552  ORF Transcript_66023/g.137552 Transcript_66023/m.137552 type:complete len:733 (+) Transcript_66023:127-2325(+)